MTLKYEISANDLELGIDVFLPLEYPANHWADSVNHGLTPRNLVFDLRMRLICRELAKREVVFQSGHLDLMYFLTKRGGLFLYLIGLPSLAPFVRTHFS